MKKLTFAIGLFGLCCLNDLHAQVVSTFAGTIGGPGSTDGTGTSARFNFPYSVCSDASGNLYVADFVSHKIRKISASGIVSTLAGSGLAGSANGTGSAASFNYPQGICADAAGNIYVGDTYNNMIRKITSAGVVSTFAGSGVTGNADGTGTGASFSHPQGICFDAGGNMYVADVGNHKIRKITPSGVVSTFAGSGIAGSADGTGTASSFNSPAGICIDANGDMYVSDSQNRKIRKVTLSGVVNTFAGSGASGATDGLGTAASFASPVGICIDASGTIYVADASNAKIRKITPSGLVSTFLGSGIAGDLDATGTAARFWNPYGICSDISGNLYIADSDNHKIKKSTPTGVVTTFAGSRALSGSTDGTGTSALFYNPQGLCSDASGNIYVADYSNQEIRQVTSSSVVTTFAGSTTPGSTNGTGSAASFFNPMGVCSDAYGNIYVADTYNHKIRKIAPSGAVTTFAGSGSAGSADGLGTAATFNEPSGVCSDINGNIYVADGASRKIRKVTPAGLVTTLAGSGAAGSTNGTGAAASFYYPQGICIDAAGDLYVADYPDHKVRKVSSAGLVTTFAGSGISGSTDGAAASATFYNPAGLCSDASGNIYVADFGNNKVRKITPSGIVSTLAGSGTPASDDGIGVSAGFSGPSGICLDASGNIFVSDYNTHKLRKITFCTEPPAPANNTASASMQVCVGNSTTLSAIGSGTVNWFSGSTGGMPIATGATISTSNTLTAGSYIYYAEDMTCMSSLTRTAISFTVNPKPTISVNSGSICSGSSFSIVPGGADTYTISGGSFNVSPATTSTYSITGTSAQGCVSSNTAVSTVSVNPKPTISVNSGSVCSGSSFSIVPGGANTYTISGGSFNVSPATTSTYSITGTSAQGCVSSNTAVSTVSVNPKPTISVNSGSVCSGSSFSIVPGGADTYTISGGSFNVSPAATSTYSITGTSAQGCVSSNTAVSTVSVNPKPTISVNSGSVCSGSSFSIVPGGANTYTISGGSFNVSPATTSTYSITGTSVQGCVSSNTAVSTVSVNASPIITAISNYSVICSGQSATLTAVGASTYTWNTGVSLPTITISPTVTTMYTVSGTNALGCNNSSTVTQSVSTCTGIESPSEPMNAISLFPNPGNGIFTIRLNATARVILTNHLGDIIFDDILNEGEQFIDIQQQASGMYMVTVKNDNNYTAFKLMKQ